MTSSMSKTPPLNGIRVVELAGIGPGPHAAMMLADLGADVVRVSRPGDPWATSFGPNHTLRGRSHVTADLKDPWQRDQVLDLVAAADVLIEGYRPGVVERLGVGPADCEARSSRLVYARMTGWGQEGPWARKAGHDINYISVTGALHAIGSASTPTVPLNLVGDFGGGSLFLVSGILAALVGRANGGGFTVVDAAMVDGVSALLQPTWEALANGGWTDAREANLLDGAAPFYRVYECADGRHVAVGALEPQFYALLLDGLELSAEQLGAQYDRETWQTQRAVFTERFASRSRDEWAQVFDGSDACVTPVLSLSEAAAHPHMNARATLRPAGGGLASGVAPRVGGHTETPPAARPATVEEVISKWTTPSR